MTGLLETLERAITESAVIADIAAVMLAYALSLPIAWNREREERSAGLRTFPLVAVACCGFIEGTESAFADDPTALGRIVAGLITGVGFIGGGAILREKDRVRGTATAASLWTTGAIGTSVGMGSYAMAGILSAVTFFTLLGLTPFKPSTRPSNDAAGGASDE